MAFSKSSVKGVLKISETYTLPASATTEYSSVLPVAFQPNLRENNRYVTFTFVASAISGTNLDIALYGCDAAGNNAVLLKDAVIADMSNGDPETAGMIDLNAYPAQYYKLAWTSDTNESANTITVKAYIAAVKP